MNRTRMQCNAHDDKIKCNTQENDMETTTNNWQIPGASEPGRYTSPIRLVLDRVFLCPGWDVLFPRVCLRALPIVGSDHAPLILDDGTRSVGCHRFQFDASWLLVEGFSTLLAQKITTFLSSPHRSFGPMDD